MPVTFLRDSIAAEIERREKCATVCPMKYYVRIRQRFCHVVQDGRCIRHNVDVILIRLAYSIAPETISILNNITTQLLSNSMKLVDSRCYN